MGVVDHAKYELRKNLALGEDEPDRWMADNVIELLDVFAKQGHSGSSAPYLVGLFKTLAMFEPIGPLTGEDDEWIEHSPGQFQNRRCSHVFKDSNGVYDSQGKVFRHENGACFTSFASRVPVVFPYAPKTEYVDVPDSE